MKTLHNSDMNSDDEHDLQESSPDLETIMQALTDPDILEPMDVYLPDAVAANPGLIHNVTPSSNPLIDTMPDVEESENSRIQPTVGG